jgi:hypothetical protein
MIVVSDTSPICYLLLIDQIDILQSLCNGVTIPQTVADELRASESPPVVKRWIAKPLNCDNSYDNNFMPFFRKIFSIVSGFTHSHIKS